MATYTKPQQWKKAKIERLGGEGDQIKYKNVFKGKFKYG